MSADWEYRTWWEAMRRRGLVQGPQTWEAWVAEPLMVPGRMPPPWRFWTDELLADAPGADR